MKLKDLEEKCVCNNGHVFEIRNAKLVPWPTNIEIFGVSYKFVSKDGDICSGCSPNKTDFLLCCPVCNCSHPFGINEAK